MKTKELVKWLEGKGFFWKKNSKHIIYSNGKYCVAVPHDRNVSPGTLRDILTIVHQDRTLANETMRQLLRG